MKINILLPFKENYSFDKASSVSITIKNNLDHSCFKNNVRIFGKKTVNVMNIENFIGISNSFNFLRSKNKNLAIQMCKILSKEKSCDQIIEVHNRPYLIPLIKKRLSNFKITLFIHNNPQEMKGSKTIKQRELLLQMSEKIYCVSQYVKNNFLEGLEENCKKVVVLYNGVDATKKTNNKKKKEIIFVGRIVKEKGVDVFVRAIEKIYHDYPEWIFKIVGSTRLGEKKLKDNYSKNVINQFKKIGKRAIYLGFQKKIDTDKIMQNASIIVIPSIWQEPFGLVAAEAMNNGIAIISSNVGGLPEIIGKSGILLKNVNHEKIANEIRNLLNDKKKLIKFQNLAKRNFRFSSYNSSKTLDLYRKEIFKKI